MRKTFKFLAIILAGLLIGGGAGVWHIRSGGFGDTPIGPWLYSRLAGSTAADDTTRSVIALYGLLALPRAEALYFTAKSDSAGRPLDGRCHYRIDGAPLSARWWSITLYNPDGYLIPNQWHRHSIGSLRAATGADGRWQAHIAPSPADDVTIPTATRGAFDITLRAYRPSGQLLADPRQVQLPTITRLECGQ